MIFVLMPSARGREQRLAVGAYDAITQQVFQAPPGMPVQMQHTRIMYGWPEEAAEAETPEERARACSEAEAALEPAPALRVDLERLPPDADVPGAFVCPISLALMQDPVVAADGHSCERSYITRWLASKTVSPKNNTPLAGAEVFSNYNLRAAIAQWFADTAMPAAAVSMETPQVQACAPRSEIAELLPCAPAAAEPAQTPQVQAGTSLSEIAELLTYDPSAAESAQTPQVPACAPRTEIAELLPCAPAAAEPAQTPQVQACAPASDAIELSGYTTPGSVGNDTASPSADVMPVAV